MSNLTRDAPDEEDDVTFDIDPLTDRNDSLSADNGGPTDGNSGLPPNNRRANRRSFLKGLGAALAIPAFASGASANDGSTGNGGTQESDMDDPSAHLGGGAGYPDVVSPSEATVVVSSHDEFASALSDAGRGDVVYVAGNAEIDVGSDELTIPEGVTLASDRGLDGSPGGLVRTPTTDQWPGVLSTEDDVRITGLRLAGPVTEYGDYVKPVASGLVITGSGCEVDNVEAWGFNHAAIRLQESAHVHHSYVHNNPMDGLGYGVKCKGGDSTVIEYNRFNYNRHSVANDGSAGYVVRYNHFGPKSVSYQVGTHRPGGTAIEIHNNTFEATDHLGSDDEHKPNVTIRGTPSDVADVHHNRFYNPLEPLDRPNMWSDEAITQVHVNEWENVTFDENAYGAAEPPEDVGCPLEQASPAPWTSPDSN